MALDLNADLEFQKFIQRRVDLVASVLGHYYGVADNNTVSQLLADIRHLCDARGFCYAERDDIAHDAYLHEIYFRDGRPPGV